MSKVFDIIASEGTSDFSLSWKGSDTISISYNYCNVKYEYSCACIEFNVYMVSIDILNKVILSIKYLSSKKRGIWLSSEERCSLALYLQNPDSEIVTCFGENGEYVKLSIEEVSALIKEQERLSFCIRGLIPEFRYWYNQECRDVDSILKHLYKHMSNTLKVVAKYL